MAEKTEEEKRKARIAATQQAVGRQGQFSAAQRIGEMLGEVVKLIKSTQNKK